MPPRIPTESDFTALKSTLPLTLHFPSPPESTTAILILLHGLGDHEAPFANFARSISLPGVLAISIRGTSPLPAALLGGEEGRHFHWGDDLKIDPSTGELDEDAGFETAERAIMEGLVRGVLVGECGWEMSDVLVFGFGQGGSLGLGMASRLRMGRRVEDVTEGEREEGKAFKGVVSIGGPLPASMVPSVSARPKSRTSVLVVQLEEEKAEVVKGEFEDVRVVNWRRREVGMPRDRDEMLPIMKFFADRLNSGW